MVKTYRTGTLTFDDPTAEAAGRVRRRVLPPELETVLVGAPQESPACLGVVSHAVELCDAGRGVADPSGPDGVGRDGAPLAA